jgi:tripartite-type tricarboxylate transporter receptor subunit TctC
VQKLNRAVIEILDRPAVRDRIKRDAIETRKMTPEEFTRFQASELEIWGPLAKRFLQTN